jgi:RNase_H superfamily
MRPHLPLPSQKRKYKFVSPRALVCPVLNVVRLLSEAQSPELRWTPKTGPFAKFLMMLKKGLSLLFDGWPLWRPLISPRPSSRALGFVIAPTVRPGYAPSGMSTSRQIVYFDLETMRSANDVGGWAHRDKMGMSIGVTFNTLTDGYTIYSEQSTEALVTELRRADLIVGFNHVGFDLPVLQPYTPWDLPTQTINLDLLLDIESKLGHRLKLEAVALATLGFGKTADGLDAIRWWRQGRIRDIAEYCAYDVKVTMAVHQFGVAHGYVKYLDKFNRSQRLDVTW